jgi:hypothetical protein
MASGSVGLVGGLLARLGLVMILAPRPHPPCAARGQIGDGAARSFNRPAVAGVCVWQIADAGYRMAIFIASPQSSNSRVDHVRGVYGDGVLDSWKNFTVDHPTKARSVVWLVLLLVFVVVAHWVIDWDRWATATFTLALTGVAFVFTTWFLTKGEEK